MTRRGIVVALAVAAALAVPAAPAFAPHVAQLMVEPTKVTPGSEVTVWGPRGFGPTNPVVIRFNSATGPVLGTFETNDEFFAAFAAGTVTIPANVQPGFYTLFATQELEDNEAYIRGVPARAVIQVVSGDAAGTAPGAPVVEQGAGIYAAEPRPQSLLVEESGTNVPALLGLAAGVALVAALAGAGLARVVARRGRAETAQEGGAGAGREETA